MVDMLVKTELVYSIKRPGAHLKFGSFNPAFFRGRRLIGIRRLSMKCDFQPFFHVDLLLPILGNLGAVCQRWTIFFAVQQLSQLCYAGTFPLNVY